MQLYSSIFFKIYMTLSETEQLHKILVNKIENILKLIL